MSWDNKVVWSEGMFLRPQHFQQFDRYVERLVRGRAASMAPYRYGFSELAVNRSLLETGGFAVSSARGVLPDGTPFAIPEDSNHPTPLEPSENTRDQVVYLCLPARQPGGYEIASASTEDVITRYRSSAFQATDVVVGSEAAAELEVGQVDPQAMRCTAARPRAISASASPVSKKSAPTARSSSTSAISHRPWTAPPRRHCRATLPNCRGCCTSAPGRSPAGSARAAPRASPRSPTSCSC